MIERFADGRLLPSRSRLEMVRRREGNGESSQVVGTCEHLETIQAVIPGTLGCKECLEIGDWWVHLRLCRTCGHAGCCDDSPNRHAGKHFLKTSHSIIEGGSGWIASA